jgi:DNA end-binding protein Ku
MARPLWTGTISFGLVNIPVSVMSATNTDKSLDFDLIDKRDKGHVGYQKYNKKTGKVVDGKFVTKALNVGGDNYVIFDPKELAKLRVPGSSSIDIQQFIDREEVNPMYFQTPYYLVPAKNGKKTYILLREALEETGKFAVGLIVMHGKRHLAAIGAEGNALILHMLRYSATLRKPAEYDLPKEEKGAAKIHAKEREMAAQLVEELSAPWRPEEYKDTYYQDVMNAVRRKSKSKIEEAPRPTEETTVGDVLDLMPLLEKSLRTRSRTKKSTSQSASHSASRSNSRRKTHQARVHS